MSFNDSYNGYEKDLGNRFRVIVEFVVEAESADDAESDVSEIIQEGILALTSQEEERDNPVHEYDVTEVEISEVY